MSFLLIGRVVNYIVRFSNSELKHGSFSYANLFYSFIHSFLIEYPTAYNITYFWNFGFLAAIFLVIQILSGIFLAMYYTPEVTLAFFSIDYIMRDLSSGWFIRYLHLNGASMFFLCIYLHIFKGLYYRSYQSPRRFVWIIGIAIYILAMGTAFLGYVLPWGQMSYWAATVITNFVTVVPYIGTDLVVWLWGGFSINNAKMNRFFSWHYILPFMIAGLVLVHLIVLHQFGSNNPTGMVADRVDKVSFYPYSYIKDFFGVGIFCIFFFFIMFFIPEWLNHSDNYILANALSTPAHIVPEWYFLPFYAILRSIQDKTYGIIAMFLAMLLFVFLPSFDVQSYVKSLSFKTIYRKVFWLIIFNLIYLGFLGANSPVSPYIELGLIGTHLHLLYLLFGISLLSFIEYYYCIFNNNFINSST